MLYTVINHTFEIKSVSKTVLIHIRHDLKILSKIWPGLYSTHTGYSHAACEQIKFWCILIWKVQLFTLI